MTEREQDKVIRMAWEDRTTFEEIQKETGLTEADVIKLMRRTLKPKSFRIWRARVSGRITKHGRKFRKNREELKAGRHPIPLDND